MAKKTKAVPPELYMSERQRLRKLGSSSQLLVVLHDSTARSTYLSIDLPPHHEASCNLAMGILQKFSESALPLICLGPSPRRADAPSSPRRALVLRPREQITARLTQKSYAGAAEPPPRVNRFHACARGGAG